MLLAMVGALVESLAWPVVVFLPAVMELDGLALNVLTSKANCLTGVGVHVEKVGFANAAAMYGRAPNQAM
jgi:hypothetical protein